MIDGWIYYNNALISDQAPHIELNVDFLNDKKIWKTGNKPLLARWTSDFDCKEETSWWYVIKDTPFDLSSLKAKRRYEINKGIKNFDVRIIDPTKYKDEICNVQKEAFTAYPEKYRPTVDETAFKSEIDQWGDHIVYGAFSKQDGCLCGYAKLFKESERHIAFRVLKTIPSYEHLALNAAIVNAILVDNASFLANGGYICDGSRSIYHETKFQDYLEKYFGFRKAYCRLHVKYSPKISLAVKALYPFRKILSKLEGINTVHKINGILKMEEIVRKDEK